MTDYTAFICSTYVYNSMANDELIKILCTILLVKWFWIYMNRISRRLILLTNVDNFWLNIKAILDRKAQLLWNVNSELPTLVANINTKLSYDF